MRKSMFGMAPLAAALLLLFAAAASAAPVKIRVGWILVPAEISPIMFADPAIAQHNGKSYIIESQRFRGSSLLTTAISSGQLDLAPFGFSSFALAVENAHLTDLRIVLDEDRDGYGGYFTTQYMVRKDSGIDKIEDLKGKAVASPAVGSISDMAMRIMLKKHGLNPATDVTVVEVALPNMTAMLEGNKAQLIASVVPFFLAPKLQETARTLFTGVEAMGPAEISFLTGRESFLRANRAALVDFFTDYLRALKWYENPKNRPAALKAISEFTKIPEERFASWVFTKQDYYRAPNGQIDPAILQKNFAVQRELGYIKTKLDAKHYVDMSLVAEAAKRAR